MATYYCRATNGDDANGGTSWADAVKTIAALNALMTANGDIGLVDIESEVSMPFTATISNSNRVIFKGVDQSDSVTPKTATLDGQSTAQDGFFFTGLNSQAWDFTIKNTTRYGVVPNTVAGYMSFVRVLTMNCATAGWFPGDNNFYYQCGDVGSPTGTLGGIASYYLLCKFSGNATKNAVAEIDTTFDLCTFSDSPIGIDIVSSGLQVKNSVFYDADTALYSTAALNSIVVLGNHFDSCLTGVANFINAATYGNYYKNTEYNNGATKNLQGIIETDTYASTSSNLINAAGGDFSTRDGADGQSITSYIGGGSSGSKSVWDVGLQSEPVSGGGGTKSRLGEIIGVKRGIGIL